MRYPNNPRFIAAAVVTALLLSGCASVADQHKENLVDRGGIDLIGSPADRTLLIIKDVNSLERYCMGPGPDLAITASDGVSLGVSVAAGLPVGGSIGESSGRGALDLGGRSPAVLLARELFYRACELTLNTNADKTEALAIYKMTMDSIERIAALQTGAGAASASAAASPVSVRLPNANNTSDVTTTGTADTTSNATINTIPWGSVSP